MTGTVRIVEMGLRDGLQNEASFLDLSTKTEFALKLAGAGLRRIEAGAFVSEKKVPQMADSKNLLAELVKSDSPGVTFSALVPNEQGMISAIEAGVREVAIFTAASETFNKKNINSSIAESFERFQPVMKLAKKNKVKVRGYISMCFGCPYEGEIAESKVLEVARRLLKLGVFEVSIGDTIGVATPHQVTSLVRKLKRVVPLKKLAMHFHDTRGTALANIAASAALGIRTFDSSVAGLGGCPYAAGASGNVATEDVVYLLHGMGFKTGVDLENLIGVSNWISEKLNRATQSKLARAGSFPKYIVQ